MDLPISTEYDFANTLRTNYLDPTTATKLDVSFDETKSRVIAARFLIQVRLTYSFIIFLLYILIQLSVDDF